MVWIVASLVFLMLSGWYMMTMRAYLINFSLYEITKYKRYYRDSKVQYKVVREGLVFIGLRVLFVTIFCMDISLRGNFAGMVFAIGIMIAEQILGVKRYLLERKVTQLLNKVISQNNVLPLNERNYEETKERMKVEAVIGKQQRNLGWNILVTFVFMVIGIYLIYFGSSQLLVWQVILLMGLLIYVGYWMYFKTLEDVTRYIKTFEETYEVKSKQKAFRTKDNRKFYKLG